MKATELPCAFCGLPRGDHGPPGESAYAKAMYEETRRPYWLAARLCPKNGVTSQFFATVDQLVGKEWQGQVSIDVVYDEGGAAEVETVGVHVAQAGKDLDRADMTFVQGHCTFCVSGLTAAALERLADFCNEAADMIRHCSE